MRPGKTIFVPVMAIFVLVAACADRGDGIALVEPPAIGPELPALDGSTSTLPLRTLLVCVIVQEPCEWNTSTATRTIVPATGGSREPFRRVVCSSGTHGSYVALANGEADLILTARVPNDEELELASAAGFAYDIEPVALDAFVFLVNASNPVGSLELDQIREIFSGATTNWSDLGGDDRPIQPYSRNPTSGSQVLMEALVMRGLPMIDAPNLMLPSMTAPFDAISRDVDGISYSVYYFATHMLPDDDIRLLNIDGVEPAVTTISSGDYPLVTEVYAVLADSAPQTSSSRLLRDWLMTAPGQELVSRSGYVPLG